MCKSCNKHLQISTLTFVLIKIVLKLCINDIRAFLSFKVEINLFKQMFSFHAISFAIYISPCRSSSKRLATNQMMENDRPDCITHSLPGLDSSHLLYPARCLADCYVVIGNLIVQAFESWDCDSRKKDPTSSCPYNAGVGSWVLPK